MKQVSRKRIRLFLPGLSKFFSKVEKTPTCWLWRGYVTGRGYGVFNWNNDHIFAHRIAIVYAAKELIPGLAVDHICRNRLCVNPEHLRQVDFKTNTLENSVGVTAKNAKKTHCVHGHEFTKANTGRYSKHSGGGRHCKKCCAIRSKRYREALAKVKELEK